MECFMLSPKRISTMFGRLDNIFNPVTVLSLAIPGLASFIKFVLCYPLFQHLNQYDHYQCHNQSE